MTQMVEIHRLFDQGWHLPLAYEFLPGNTEALYTDLFSALDSVGQYDPQMHKVSSAIISTLFTMLSSIPGLVLPFEAVFSIIVSAGPRAQTPTVWPGTRLRSGRLLCSNLFQDDVRSILRSRGHHTNCLETYQAPHPK